MARVGTDLTGVAAFHAGLGAAGPQAAPGKVKAKVLVLNGADDPFIKPDQVDAFKKEMEAGRFMGHSRNGYSPSTERSSRRGS